MHQKNDIFREEKKAFYKNVILAISSRRQQATFYSQRKREIAVLCGIKKVPQPLKNNFAGVNKEEGVNDLKNFSRSRQRTILKNQLVFVQPKFKYNSPERPSHDVENHTPTDLPYFSTLQFSKQEDVDFKFLHVRNCGFQSKNRFASNGV